MSRDATTAFARTLVDEWVRHGVTDGARARIPFGAARAALADDGGSGSTSTSTSGRRPSSRSGSAGDGPTRGRGVHVGDRRANFHPAVLEAHHGRVPLIVAPPIGRPSSATSAPARPSTRCTSTATPSAGSSIPGCPTTAPGAGRVAPVAARTVPTPGPPAGPVHLNLPFREPLVPTRRRRSSRARSVRRPSVDRGAPGARARDGMLDALRSLDRATPSGSWSPGGAPAVDARDAAALRRAAGWPCSPIPSRTCAVRTVSTYDACCAAPRRRAAHRPDLVVRSVRR